MILRVEEPATCEYIITVHSKGLCKHPAFKTEAKTRKFDLVCAPALREKAFNRYQQRKQEELDKKRAEEEQGTYLNFTFFTVLFSKINGEIVVVEEIAYC